MTQRSFPVDDKAAFNDALAGLERGDFSRLAPLFEEGPNAAKEKPRIIAWNEAGRFRDQPKALAEALTCACFLGATEVALYLLNQGVDPDAGIDTGLNAFHWAANRGQLTTVRLLIERRAPLETRSMYDGTVLGSAVWAAVHEAKPDHLAIIEALLEAGANSSAAEYPSGNAHVDELLRRFGAQ